MFRRNFLLSLLAWIPFLGTKKPGPATVDDEWFTCANTLKINMGNGEVIIDKEKWYHVMVITTPQHDDRLYINGEEQEWN